MQQYVNTNSLFQMSSTNLLPSTSSGVSPAVGKSHFGGRELVVATKSKPPSVPPKLSEAKIPGKIKYRSLLKG